MSVWVEMFHFVNSCQSHFVTLHVSVWVEIFRAKITNYTGNVTLHVSVWVEISIPLIVLGLSNVTLHVSVWVEMIPLIFICTVMTSHAPRERVSWNVLLDEFVKCHCQSRSTWACELKCFCYMLKLNRPCHAPRERVSWNLQCRRERQGYCVTLHVSVWVEIYG